MLKHTWLPSSNTTNSVGPPAARARRSPSAAGIILSPALAAAFDPGLKACVSNCGPFDFGAVLPTMPAALAGDFPRQEPCQLGYRVCIYRSFILGRKPNRKE